MIQRCGDAKLHVVENTYRDCEICEKLVDVAKTDVGYIAWAKENMTREPVKSLLAQL